MASADKTLEHFILPARPERDYTEEVDSQKAHGYADKAIYLVLTIFQYIKVIAIIRQADKSGTFALFLISPAKSNVAFIPTLMTKACHALVKSGAAFFYYFMTADCSKDTASFMGLLLI